MSGNRWPTATPERACPVCGHTNRCRIAPDGTAAVCWRNGGKVQQLDQHKRANGNGTGHVGEAHRRAVSSSAGNAAKSYPVAQAAIDAAGRMIKGSFVAGWSYHNRDASEALRVIRYALADGDKQYRPIHQAKDGWRIGDPSGPLPLYRLLEIVGSSGPIYVCEGEKAADAAARIGLPATTSAHGSGSAEKTDWSPLSGREVVILPDNDEPGRKYAQDVARLLVKLDPPVRVKIVELPGLPDKGDVVEYIDARTGMAGDVIRDDVVALAAQTPELPAADLIGGPVLTCLADVEARKIDWLWQGRVPAGCITLLAGRPKEGKSFATIDMAARVTTGTPFPDGTSCPKGSVILITAEDDPARVIRPRLDAHHADCRKVHLLSAVRRIDAEGKHHEVMFTLADVAALETALKLLPDCRLIIVDPVGSFLGGKTDAHRDNEVRAVLAPLARLAERYGPAVVVVAHHRKGAGQAADDLALGSRAFTGLARANWHLTRDKENKARRLLLPGGGNYFDDEVNGMAFTIAGDPPVISWERDPVAMSADDALAQENGNGDEERKPGPEPEARSQAVEWLRDLLQAGAMESSKIKIEAEAAGYAWRTVHRAKDVLGIKPYREQFGGAWMWKLPADPACQDLPCHVPENGENLASWHDSENPTKNGAVDVPKCLPCQDNQSGTIGAVALPAGDGWQRGRI